MTPLVRAPDRTAPLARRTAVLAEVEAERAAVARLLHDEVMQTLITARWFAEKAGDETTRDAVRDAIAEAGAAMWRLRPRTSDGRLVRALDELAERHPGRVVTVRAAGVPDVLDVDAATVAFRVVQAALDAATGGTVDVGVEVRGGTLAVTFCDDGPAYDTALHQPDSELTRWLSRAGLLGGGARVGDAAGGGTTLWLEIPDALPKEPGA
jgi:signal transduction histidine kinase